MRPRVQDSAVSSEVHETSELVAMRARISKLEEEWKEAKAESVLLKQTLSNLELDFNNVKQRNTLLEVELSWLVEKNTKLELKDKEREEECKEIRVLLSSLESRQEKQDKFMEEVKSKDVIEEVRKEAVRIKTAHDEIQGRNSEIMRNIAKANETVEVCKEKIERSYAEIVVKEKQIQKELESVTKENKLDAEVKNVIRKNEKLIRDTVDKNKSVLIFGHQEKEIKSRIERDRDELNCIRKIMKHLLGDDDTEIEIMEYRRIGKYVKGKNRPIKITLMNSYMAETLLKNGPKLKDVEGCKSIKVRRDLSKEDRELLKSKFEEANKQNDERTEEEKESFFFRVVGLQIRKWYFKKDNQSARESVGAKRVSQEPVEV